MLTKKQLELLKPRGPVKIGGPHSRPIKWQHFKDGSVSANLELRSNRLAYIYAYIYPMENRFDIEDISGNIIGKALSMDEAKQQVFDRLNSPDEQGFVNMTL